jgi:hypothetical protein
MKIKTIIIVSLISIFYNCAFAQLDDTLKARLYLTRAQELFRKYDFNASLDYVEKAENTLGKKVAQSQTLRIKIALKQENHILARELFNDYKNIYMQSTSKEFNDEFLRWVQIEEAILTEKNHLLFTSFNIVIIYFRAHFKN